MSNIINNISERDEQILKLKWVDDKTNKEVTELTGWSKSTISRTVQKYIMVQDALTAKWSGTNRKINPKTVKTNTVKPQPTPAPPHFVTDDVVTVVVEGKVFNFDHTHPHYESIRNAVALEDWDAVNDTADYKKTFKKLTFGFFEITEDGQLLHHGKPVEYDFAQKIIDLHEKDVRPTALLKFFERLKSNPSNISVESALRFITNNSLPIDKEGYLFTYKKINQNWTDCHTGTIDNSIGNVVAMERDRVTLDPSQTCSSGLHVCSYGYLAEFSGSRIIVCKVDPSDIVSVPHDYNNAKMRVMRYEVIAELKNGETIPDDFIDHTCDWYR
jgi:hypothetical protein